MNQHNELVKVEFQGQQIEATLYLNEVFVSMKKVCDNLGIDFSSQRKKVNSHPAMKTTVGLITTVGEDGKLRSMYSIKLDSLPLWLIGIHPNKVSKEVRPLLVKYQLEAKEVLAAHFFGQPQQQPTKQMTHLEILHAQSGALLEQERRTALLEAKTAALESTIQRQEAEREESWQMLLALPEASEDVPEVPLNKRIHQVVGLAWRTGSGMHPSEAFPYLYEQMKLRHGVDLVTRAKNRGKRAERDGERKKKWSPMEIAIEQGYTQKLYDLAVNLLQKNTPNR